MNQSFGDPAVAFLRQVHAVPAERSVLPINRAAQVKVTKMCLTLKALFEYGLQRSLLLDVLIADVGFGYDQDSFAVFECRIGYVVNLLAIELPLCGACALRYCRRSLAGISERADFGASLVVPESFRPRGANTDDRLRMRFILPKEKVELI